MAKNIEINIKDSTGNYETLYPQTIASQIATGVLADARIPSLSTSKITSGTFDTARIPNLSANKITEGTFSGSLTGEYVFPGNLRIGGTSSNSNAKIRIGDNDYVYFHEDTDDNLTIKAKRIEFTTTSNPGLTNNGVALGGSSIKIGHTAYSGVGAFSRSTVTVSNYTSTCVAVFITLTSTMSSSSEWQANGGYAPVALKGNFGRYTPGIKVGITLSASNNVVNYQGNGNFRVYDYYNLSGATYYLVALFV